MDFGDFGPLLVSKYQHKENVAAINYLTRLVGACALSYPIKSQVMATDVLLAVVTNGA